MATLLAADYRGGMVRVALLVTALLGATLPRGAFAQGDDDTCPMPGEPEPRAVTPATGARSVPTNARLRVEYSADIGPVAVPGALLELFLCPPETTLAAADVTTCTEPVSTREEGEAQTTRNELLFEPARGFLAERVYTGLAFAPTGFGELRVAFETGPGPDMTAPILRARDVVPSGTPADFECGELRSGIRIDVRVRPALLDPLDATDPDRRTEPATSIEYLLFQTRGPGLDAPTLRARGRGISATTDVTLAFGLRSEDASTPICVTVQAVDGQGAASLPMDDVCFEPLTGNFFEGLCAAGGAPVGAWPALVALVLRRRRRVRS